MTVGTVPANTTQTGTTINLPVQKQNAITCLFYICSGAVTHSDTALPTFEWSLIQSNVKFAPRKNNSNIFLTPRRNIHHTQWNMHKRMITNNHASSPIILFIRSIRTILQYIALQSTHSMFLNISLRLSTNNKLSLIIIVRPLISSKRSIRIRRSRIKIRKPMTRIISISFSISNSQGAYYFRFLSRNIKNLLLTINSSQIIQRIIWNTSLQKHSRPTNLIRRKIEISSIIAT